MRELNVSLDLESSVHSLGELARLSGCEPDEGSHDLGEPHPKGRAWGSTRLRIDSGMPPTAPLDTHLEALIALTKGIHPIKDVDLFLSVALFHDQPMASVVVPMRYLREFVSRVESIEVVTYLCVPEDQ